MKKLAATLCIVGTVLALSACETTGKGDTSENAAPYASERTAGYNHDAAPAERTFKQKQMK